MAKKKIFLLLAFSAVTLGQAALAIACAVCLTGADDAITEGYNASVFFLMAAPYVVGACIAAGLYCAYRRAVKRREQNEENTISQLEWNQEESRQ